MSGFVLPETGLPALGPLLDGSLWPRWAADGRVFPLAEFRRAVGYVRLKPQVSCRITVFDQMEGRGDRPPPGFLLLLFADASRAREAFEKESSRRHLESASGFRPFLSEDPPVVALPFPHDPEVPDLRHVYEPDRFRRTLAELLADYPTETWRIQRQLLKTRLLTYKPGRRAVYQLKVKLRRRTGDEKVRVHMHLKVENPRTVERSYRNLSLVHDQLRAPSPWCVPRPRGFVEARSVVATEWIEAPALSSLIARGSPAVVEHLADTGRALAALHALELRLEHLPSPLEEAESLETLARDLVGILPGDAASIRELTHRVVQSGHQISLSRSAIVHGDFHPAQVLIVDGRPCFVDFDRAGRGYAYSDLGSFLARLIEENRPPRLGEALLSGYREAAPTSVEEELVRTSTATALLRGAMAPFRSLRTDWPEETRRRLMAADRLLEGY